jgi:1-acyl-sn-glycerol-3-phosphate acyltransferase
VRAVLHLLISLFVWGSTIVVLLLLTPVLAVIRLVTAPFDPGRRLVGRLFHGVGRFLVAINPLWDFRVERRNTQPFREPSVIISNHESDADVFLSAQLPWDAKYLAKDTIYNIPVMGWAMRLAGDIGVVRGDRESGALAREECRRWLERGVSVVIYPEGTRSRTGDLGPFKEGAFRLAIETGAAIQPVVVAGTRDAVPPGSIVFHRAHAVARILDPVPVEGLGSDDVPAFTERMRALIERERDALRRDLGLAP